MILHTYRRRRAGGNYQGLRECKTIVASSHFLLESRLRKCLLYAEGTDDRWRPNEGSLDDLPT